MRRRTFLARSAAAATGAALAGLGVRGAVSDPPAGGAPGGNPAGMLLEGTRYETPIYAREGSESGPTAVVVGGLHGDEVAGYRAAERVARWRFDAGTVVVLPRANRPAIRRGTRHGVGGDLNRKFPPGEAPTTRLARAIWEFVQARDPDVVLDLHESEGIYGVHPGLVGQALFPTAVGDAPAHADEVIGVLNEEVVPWYMPLHDYRRGNDLRGTAPLLGHKVAADLELPGYIVETVEFMLDIETRTRWEARAAAELLARHGLRPRGDGVPSEVTGG